MNTRTVGQQLGEQWLYFGCVGTPGHYVFNERLQTIYNGAVEKLNYFDGKLAPQHSSDGYVATVSRLGGWGLSALSFWDYSVDKRGGCNSIFFAPSLTIEPIEMLIEARKRFPSIWARFPQEVILGEGLAA